MHNGMCKRALNHKKAIQAEMQRREDLKNEKRMQEEEAARAKERRRERRMCLKEQKRIQGLSEVLMLSVVPSAEQKEYAPSMPIYDVRSYDAEAPAGIHTFGGFVGELIITLHCLNENLTSKGENPSFEMQAETIMKFMEDLLADGYPQGVCTLRLTADPLTEPERNDEPANRQAAIAAKRLSEGMKLAQYGTKFLLQGMPVNFVSKEIK